MILLFVRRLAAVVPPLPPVVLAALRGVILTRETAAPFVVSEDRARPLVVSTDIAAPAIITTDSVRVRRG
jgi:hypothetical protein